jgi:voltage-gated potassium channel
VSAADVDAMEKIIKALDKSGLLLGADLPEKEIWDIVENADTVPFPVT